MARHIREALQMQKRRETLTGRMRAGHNGGQALVEFAWVLPILMLVMVAILKFGIFFYNYITLCNAVNTAARTLAVNRGVGTGPPTACTLATTALTTAAQNLVTSQITTSITFPSPDTSTCSSLQTGDSAVVQATYPCSLVIFGYNVIPGCALNSQTTVRIE